MQLQKVSFDVGMNGDDSLTRLQPGEYFNALNFRGGTSERGHISGLQTVPGTTLLYNSLPAGQNYCIGGSEDEGKSQFFWFNYNLNGNHAIYCYDQSSNAVFPVILNSQVTGGFGWEVFTYIHSCFVVNRNLYWTDNIMPRRFNVDYAMEMNFDITNPLPGYIPSPTTPAIEQLVGTTLTEFYELPNAPVPSYQSGQLILKFQRQGHGPHGIPTFIPIITDPAVWAQYPGTKSYQQIVADAINTYFTVTNPAGGNASSLGVVGGNPGLSVNINWDWNTGDSTFAPLTQITLLFNSFVRADGKPTNPYVGPVSQAVIAWIRRPPAFPPFQTKILESPVPSSNFIGDQAFQFCWRYGFLDKENSTLSPLSDTADFNEEDPPPIETSLEVPNNNLPTRGYLATNILLPTSPTPSYGAGVYAKITRVGSGGPDAGATDIPIPLDWTGYPALKSYTRIVVEGLAKYFAGLPGSDNDGELTPGPLPQSVGHTSSKWYISYRDGAHPTLNISQSWDWGIGDTAFPPTTSANLTLYTQTKPNSRQFSLINVTLPLAEVIDQDVMQVDLVAAYLVSGTYYIIKSWRKALSADSAAIIAHNAGTTPLSYGFRNDQLGIALDPAYSVKQNDSVPIAAQTAALAKNRSFFGGIVNGYDSSNLPTSLSITPVTTVVGQPISAGIQGEWFSIRYVSLGSPTLFTTSYIIRTTQPAGNQPAGQPYYYYTISGAALPLPVDVTTGLIYIGIDLADVMTFYHSRVFIDSADQGVSVALLPEVPSADYGVQYKAFKMNSAYQATMTFYDGYLRHGGTITNDSLKIPIPNTGFDQNAYVTALAWAVNNNNAFSEIPDTAVYYSIGISKCLRTRFFVEAIGFVTYCAIDGSGTLTFTETIYNPDLHGVAIDISFLVSNGMGYTFNAGDICDFYVNGVYYSLGVIGVEGNFLICRLYNLGTIGSSALAQYEIFTPYKQQSNEPSYEQGQLYAIANPGTPAKQYSVLSGAIPGDVFLFLRSNNGIVYTAEAMSPNNKYYSQWITNAGRPNFTDFIGQVDKRMSGAYSNPFVQGSQNNGLSTFDALDTFDLSQEFGDLQKLLLTSKIQKEGTVMLAICIRETVSLYLSETQVAAPQGNAFLAVASSVIGTIYPLKGSMGTIDPESAVIFRGNAYWLDVNNGGPVMYSDNGLELITKKMHTFWRKWCAKYKGLSKSAVAALGSRPFVIGGVDVFNEEILFTLPKITASVPKGTLPGYTSNAPANLFDCYDGMAKTMVYKIKKDYWNPALQITGEAYMSLGTTLYGFKNGAPWLHNDTTAPANSFYGAVYAALVMFTCTDLPNVPKKFLSMNVEADTIPGWMIMLSDYPNVQITDIESDEWNNKEGVFYRALFRDRLSPQFTDFNRALLYGDKILGKAPMIQLAFGLTGPGELPNVGYCALKYVNIEYQASAGHKTLPTK